MRITKMDSCEDDSSDNDQENTTVTTTNTTSNSDMKTSQQRKLCYRELLNKIEDIEDSEDLGMKTVKYIGDIIKKANDIELECNLSQRYLHPDETVLDSIVLSSASSILVKCIEAVDISIIPYQPTEFADKLKQMLAGDEDFEDEHIINVIVDAQQTIPKVPSYAALYGAYDLNTLPQPKQKKERVKEQKEKFERKQPEKLTGVKAEEKAIEEIVKTLYDVLKKHYRRNNCNPINYYDYVVDTESYGSTVENMFYCSFIVKDGRARIDLDNYGVPFIEPMSKQELESFQSEGGKYSQMISTITVPQWETFKKPGYLQKNRKRQLEK